MFKDKVLLITGGTGSFEKMRIFSRHEKKQDDKA